MFLIKNKFPFLLIVAYIFLPYYITAQQYSYGHLTSERGLAGNTVYTISQDLHGYLWFATDNGLSRFDGKNLKNFTTKDGLPDNEVLKIFSDSYGRTWISTFNKQVCYVKGGTIYTSKNSILLKHIEFNENLNEMFESNERSIFLCTSTKIVEVSNNNAKVVVEFKKNQLDTIKNFGCSYNDKEKCAIIFINYRFYKYKNGKMSFLYKDKTINSKVKITIISKGFTKNVAIKKPSNYILANFKNNHAIFINTHNGSQKIDTTTGKVVETFLPNERVSYTFEDRENNLWFATLGNGVFKLKSREIKYFPFELNENNSEVFSVNQFNNQIVAGLSFGKAISIHPNTKKNNPLPFPENATLSQNALRVNRLTSILPINPTTCFFGFDSYLTKIENKNLQFAFLKPIKSLDFIDKNTILVGTSNYAITLGVKDLKIIDTIYNQRCTKVKYAFGNYFIGTQTGLLINNIKTKYINDRVTDIAVTKDSIIWVATNGNGVYGLKNNKLVYRITEQNGLTSNNIKSLFIKDTIVWIGTFNGLNKWDRSTSKNTTYTTDDGLPSDIINAIYEDKNILWLATNVGLITFNEHKVNKTSFCNISPISITSSSNNISNEPIVLAYNSNNIKFIHDGISFKSEKGIVFKYKMDGLDASWNESNSGTVNYPSLPYGNFTFSIYVQNKFGVKSKILSYKIEVQKPYWLQTWFLLLSGFLLICLASFLVFIYIRRIKKRNNERTNFLTELHYAKQMALQTQMNPHFIFNCLNNIQKFILKNDIENTNKYLTNFATLIRTTLANADKLSIPLVDEISYLTRYLEMEKLRFDDKLSYTFDIAKNIDLETTEVPTMLFQPFIENSIKHGILNKTDGVGLITISFWLDKEFLHCKIVDNGIGRVESERIKSLENVLFESKGMDITNRRIDMLNFNKETKIRIEIEDLYNAQKQSLGTAVNIEIPLNFYYAN